MTLRSIGTALAAGMICVLAMAPAQSAERTLVDRVKGWDIERDAASTDGHPCQISKSYKDKDDNNAENVIVFALTDDAIVISLGYENWVWDKDEKMTISLVFDGKVYDTKSKWIGDGTTLYTKYPEGLTSKLLTTKSMVLRFKDGDADFDLAGFTAAYEGMKRCEQSAPAAAAVAPPMPSDVRIKSYLFGLMLQENVKECDVRTSAKQRAGLDARVAALQPEMAPLESSLRESLKNRPGTRCPTAANATKFDETLRSYIDNVPEDFAAEMDKAEKKKAEEAAAPKPEPAAPKAEPITPKPEPVAPKAEPVAPQAEPVAPKAEPVAPKPEPVAPNAEPAAPKP